MGEQGRPEIKTIPEGWSCETCRCDKVVASCLAGALHSYNKSYRFYFKLKCRGSKLQC
uniref:Uncharacterized protein n=1 Tax=Apteryx owenii TaxID=8824 RepID=A0A8B9PZ78_APTOW